MDRPPAGMSLVPLACFGVVTIAELFTMTFSFAGWSAQAVAATSLVFTLVLSYEATQTYWPAALGMKLTAGVEPGPPNVPLPATGTTTGPKATVVQLSGPKAVNVIEPGPAAPTAPVVLNGGTAGAVATPASVPVSLIGWPSATEAEAWVSSVGVTGLTVKHSVAVPSDTSGTPVVAESNSARKQ